MPAKNSLTLTSIEIPQTNSAVETATNEGIAISQEINGKHSMGMTPKSFDTATRVDLPKS
jgi:hypothetical protein